MKQYECLELTFSAAEPAGSQVAVDLAATFQIGDERKNVKGFYAGDGIYKIRFYPDRIGDYRYEVHGVIEQNGEECCKNGGSHGIVRSVATHFIHDDGTPFLPFGTTVYALIHQEKALIDQTMLALRTAPFNKVRLCVFPKSYDFNNNEPELFAFEKTDGKWDFNRPCFAFWDMLDSRIDELERMGIQADLILFHPYDRWGFASLTKEQCLSYLDYITRRLSAHVNVWWSLANEYDLMNEFPEQWWTEFAAFLGGADPWKHLLSNHNCMRYWDFANPSTTHCCIQSHRVEETAAWAKKYNKPVIYDEMCYEGNICQDWGNISAFELVNRFWKVCSCGGYATHGETYMDTNDVLWWSKGGTLKGDSPQRIAFLRDIIESLPGPLEFHSLVPISSYEQLQAMKNTYIPGITDSPFVQSMFRMTSEEINRLLESSHQYTGRFKDQAFLHYYARACTIIARMDLPENSTYQVDVIDVWEMSRKTVLAQTKGKVEITLPGKEGMAVLALKK